MLLGQHANRELRDCIASMQQDFDKGPEGWFNIFSCSEASL